MALDRTWYNALVDDDGSGMTGSVWDKADIANLLNSVDAEIARLDTRANAICKVFNPAVQPWGSGVWAKVPFGAAEFDPLNMHTDGDFFIWFPEPGKYGISAFCAWPGGAGGRWMSLNINDAFPQYPGSWNQAAHPTYGVTMQITTVMQVLGPGWNVSVQMFQDSGAQVNIPAHALQLNVWRIS